MRNVLPVLTVLLVIVGIWYAAAIWMNSAWTLDRADGPLTFSEIVTDTMSQDRPRLPAPHQVWAEFRKTVFDTKVTSKRSLVFHGWITLSSTLAGFALGTLTGILMAVGIVYSRPVSMSLMPWAIISQTIPIVALAPMIIVVLASLGVDGRAVPKAIISAYLCYFPVLVGMVKGLKSPDAMQLDLMKTWSATGWQSFWRLRFPSSVPYLFTSLKVGIAAALHLAAALGPARACGLGTGLLLEHDMLKNPLVPVRGHITVPQMPGLGVEIDHDAVDHYTTGVMGVIAG